MPELKEKPFEQTKRKPTLLEAIDDLDDHEARHELRQFVKSWATFDFRDIQDMQDFANFSMKFFTLVMFVQPQNSHLNKTLAQGWKIIEGAAKVWQGFLNVEFPEQFRELVVAERRRIESSLKAALTKEQFERYQRYYIEATTETSE